MFGIGTTELMVILLLALLVLGPSRLPGAASGIAKAIREFRKAARDITSQLDVDDSVTQPFQELRSALSDQPGPLPRIRPPEQAPIPVTGQGAMATGAAHEISPLDEAAASASAPSHAVPAVPAAVTPTATASGDHASPESATPVPPIAPSSTAQG